MKKEFTIKLNELEEQYNSLKEDLQHTARLDKDELREVVDTISDFILSFIHLFIIVQIILWLRNMTVIVSYSD